jgi:hypothetical protein
MRPVADVVRRGVSRRNGEGLPLDPVTAVGEYAAYVTQRRDMFFAAQTARRLRDLEGFPLRVPDGVPRLLDGTVRDVRGPCGDRAARCKGV